MKFVIEAKEKFPKLQKSMIRPVLSNIAFGDKGSYHFYLFQRRVQPWMGLLRGLVVSEHDWKSCCSVYPMFPKPHADVSNYRGPFLYREKEIFGQENISVELFIENKSNLKRRKGFQTPTLNIPCILKPTHIVLKMECLRTNRFIFIIHLQAIFHWVLPI